MSVHSMVLVLRTEWSRAGGGGDARRVCEGEGGPRCVLNSVKALENNGGTLFRRLKL